MIGALIIVSLALLILFLGATHQHREWIRNQWMGYYAQLPASEMLPSEDLFIGFPGKLGDLWPKNRDVMRAWLNVRVGEAGLQFEISWGAPLAYRALPPLFIPWNQVKGLRAEVASALPEALRPMAWDRPAFHLDLGLPIDAATGQPIPVWISAAASESEALMKAIQGHLGSRPTAS